MRLAGLHSKATAVENLAIEIREKGVKAVDARSVDAMSTEKRSAPERRSWFDRFLFAQLAKVPHTSQRETRDVTTALTDVSIGLGSLDPHAVKKGLEALKGTELEGIISADDIATLESLANQRRSEPTNIFNRATFDPERAAQSLDSRTGPYQPIARARRAVAHDLREDMSGFAVANGLEADNSYSLGRKFIGRSLRLELPDDFVVQHFSITLRAEDAGQAGRKIPVPKTQQDQLIRAVYLDRNIPHADSSMRSASSVTQSHIEILEALAKIYDEVEIPKSKIDEVVNKFLNQTEPSFIHDDQFLADHLFDGLKAMEGQDWSATQMLTMLHFGRATNDVGPHNPAITKLQVLTEMGLSYEETLASMKENFLSVDHNARAA